MIRTRSWLFGYRATRLHAASQHGLPRPECTQPDPYLRTHCGGCNPGCDLLGAGVTPDSPGLPWIFAHICGLSFDVQGLAIDNRVLPPDVTLIWDNHDTIPPLYTCPLAIKPELVFPVRHGKHGVACRPVLDVRQKLGLRKDARLWLTGNSEDEVLEWMWANPGEVRRAHKANRFELIMSADHSVYGDRCPIEWRVNMKRSLISYSELHAVCKAPVPTISIPNEFFAECWAEWLARNPLVNCVAVNAQMWRQEQEFEAMFPLVAYLRDLVKRDLHYIVCGPVASDRRSLVRASLPHSTIVSSDWFNAWHRSAA